MPSPSGQRPTSGGGSSDPRGGVSADVVIDPVVGPEVVTGSTGEGRVYLVLAAAGAAVIWRELRREAKAPVAGG